MREISIKFKCPHCGHDELSEVQIDVSTSHLVRKMVIADSDSDKKAGKKFTVLHDFQGLTGGRVEKYMCNACGHILHGEPRGGTVGAVVSNAKNLYSWLKRNNMLPE